MKSSSLLLQVSGHWVLRRWIFMSAALWSRSCPALRSTLPQLHNNTLPARQHQIDKHREWRNDPNNSHIDLSTHSTREFLCLFKKKKSNTFYLQISTSKVVIHLGAACFGSKLFMKNMPLKPRPLKKWEVIVVFKQPFSHSPSFIRTTARLCCVEGSCNVRASVSLVLTAWRYSSTILLCVHLKVQIKPVTLNEIKRVTLRFYDRLR